MIIDRYLKIVLTVSLMIFRKSLINYTLNEFRDKMIDKFIRYHKRI